MGIEQTKSLLKTFYSSPPSKGENYLKMAFNTECLQLDEFINFYWKEKSTEHLGLTNLPTKSSVNERDKEKFNLKEELLFPEIQGKYQNPEKAFNVECLSEFRNFYIPENTNKFTKIQMKRMNVLLFAYVKKILEEFNENSTIECISKYFDSIMINNKDKIDFNSIGINLFIKLISDISKGNVQIKEKNLDFMLENNKFIRPLSFYGETKEHFILDKALDKIIDYLKEIIYDEKEKDINKIKSLKIIFNLALAKGSLKNLLDVISLLDKINNKNIDLNYELNLFKNEFRKFGLGEPKSTNKSLESQVWNYTLKKEEVDKNNNSNDKKKEKNEEYYSITNDGTYLYYYCSKGVLLKIGTGFNNTMLGKVYNKKENYRVGEKATIAFVEDILYYRSNNLDPEPIISINPETLEEMPNKFSVDYSEINHIFNEEKRIEFEFPHTSNKDMNEIIERKKNAGLEDKSNLRPSNPSPMISDGRFIYVVSKWFDEEGENEKKEEEDDMEAVDNTENKDFKGKNIYGVNIYDPLNNMCHVRCVQLIPVLEEKEEKTDSQQREKNKGKNDDYRDRDRERERRRIRREGLFFRREERERERDEYDEDRNRFSDNKNKDQDNSQITLSKDFLQGQNKLYTNGAILYINQYKFSLVTGQLLGFCDLNSYKTNSYCYDFTNNVIWCMYRDPYSEDKLSINSFYNDSAKINYEYPKDHQKYSPGNIEKIIESCEKNINLMNLKEEVNNRVYKRQETLDLLGLEDDETKKYKDIKIINESINDNFEQYKLNLQCLILNIIAKVSEFYGQVPDLKIASNDVERGKILSQAMRRPYCVKLEPKTFKELIQLLIQYSQNFIKGNYTDTEAFCLLAIVKIISTNLKCLSISNLGIEYFLNKNSKDNKDNINPFIQMKEFIFNIIKIYHEDKIEKNDLFKSVYEECKIILKVSFDTLYQKNSDIVQILCDSLNKSDYSQDIASCILHWMSVPDNINKILKNSDEETMDKIFNIFKTISSLEVSSLHDFLISNKKNLENIDKVIFKQNEFENVSFKFISSLQLELIKFLSKKLINDQYEDSYYEKLIHLFTQILFNNLTQIFSDIKNFIEDASKIIEQNYNKKYTKAKNIMSNFDINTLDEEEEEEEMIITTEEKPLKKMDKKDNEIITSNNKDNNNEIEEIPSLEEYTTNQMNNIYNNLILKELLNNLYHIQILIFHINSLSILSSDYILSAYLLQDFLPLIKEMNEIYTKVSSYCQIQTKEIYVKNEEYKEKIIETEHPYVSGASQEFILEIPGQKGPLYLEFDEKSQLASPDETNCANAIFFFKDVRRRENYFSNINKINKEFPKEPLELKTLPCYMLFQSYSQNKNNCYGFKLKLHNGKDINVKKEVNDNLFNLIRIVNWVGCKCAAIIIKGIFMKPPQSTEKNEKYDELLKDILFKEGINLSEVFNEKEKIINNIITIFTSYKNINLNLNIENMTQENTTLEKELNLFTDEACGRALQILQKKLITKNIGYRVGGENGFKLVKICFLSMLHHTGEINTFIEQMLNKDEESIYKAKNFESLFKKFTMANQMRSWLMEKKKNIAESIEKQNQESENQNEGNTNNTNDLEIKVENYIKKVINQATNKAKLLIKINPNKNLDEEKDINKLCSSIISYFKENISYKRLQRNIKIYTLRAIGRQIGFEMLFDIFNSISNGTLLQDLLSWFNASLKYNNTTFENGNKNIGNSFNSYLDNILGCGEELKNNIKNSFQKFMDLLIQKFLYNSNEKELDSFLDSLIWKYNIEDHQFLMDKNVFNILRGMENETLKGAWGKSYLTEETNLKDNYNTNKAMKNIKENNLLYEGRYVRRYENIIYEETSVASLFPRIPNELELRKFETFKSTVPLFTYSKNLTNEILEVFEILSSICMDSIINNKESITDIGSTSALIQNIINIIFGEIDQASNNYLEYRGISKRLVMQYDLFIEEGKNKKDLKKKEKDKKVEEMIENIRRQRIQQINEGIFDFHESDEFDPIDEVEPNINRLDIERKVSDIERKKLEGENKVKTNEKKYFFYESDIENMYETAMNFGCNKIDKKIYVTGEELLQIISAQWGSIYDPKFLNKLLQILYKISIQNTKIIIDCLNSSGYIYSLIKLMKYCSTPEKILSAKILGNICLKAEKENLEEVISLYYDEYGKTFDSFLSLLIDSTFLIRKKCWNTGETNSTGNYILSNYLIRIIRDLINSNKYTSEINDIINKLDLSNCKENDEYIKKEIILSIIGIDYFGQANGSRVLVPNPLSNFSTPYAQGVDEIKPITGTIIGFSRNINELFGIVESNSKKLEEQDLNRRYYDNVNNINDNMPKTDVKGEINITPNNDLENKVGILLDNSLNNKTDFNVQELFPKVFDQCKVMPIIDSFDYDKINIGQNVIDYLIDFLEKNIIINNNNVISNDINEIKEIKEENKNNKNIDNNIINLCTNIIRFLYSYLEYQSRKKGDKIEIKISPKLIKFFMSNSTKAIFYGSHFLNLEFNEEKLYRVLNYCNESKESLEEIPTLSIKFISNVSYLFRIYNGTNKNMSLSNTIINIENKNIFSKLLDSGYYDFYTYINRDTLLTDIKNATKKNFILILGKDTNIQEIFELIKSSKKNYKISNFIVISDQVFTKETKKEDNICYIQIMEEELNEIVEIINELNNNKKGVYNNEVLKMVFTDNSNKNKNEKEIILDELSNDFGFDKENINEIMKESPDLDLNNLISNLIYNNKKEEKNKQKENNEENININNNINTDLNFQGGLFGPHTNIPIFPLMYGNDRINTIFNEQRNILNNQFNLNNENDNNNIIIETKEKKKKKKKKGKKEKTEEDIINKKIKDEEDKIKGKIKKKQEEDDEDKKEEKTEDKKDEDENNNNINLNIVNDNNNIEKDESEEETEEEDGNNNEKIEKEEKNDCFGFDNEKNIQYYPDFEKELFISPTLDKSNLFLIYKNLNKRINILYSRRIILTILKIYLMDENQDDLEKLIDSFNKEDLYIIIKLLVHEGFFIKSLDLGSELLSSIKTILLKLNSSKNIKIQEIISYFIDKSLEEIKHVTDSSSFSYLTNFSDESDITSKPYIFFNVWLIMIFSDLQENPVLNSIHKNCITIFNLLGGLITKISKNKEFRWFVMDTFIFYCQSVLHILNSSNKEIILNQVLDKEFSKFELIPNILKLQTFLKELMSLEGMSNLSKRTQMIAEILILIASIDKKVKQIKEEEININKENIVENKEKIKNKFLLHKLDKNSLKYKEIYGENKKGELQNFIYDLLLTTKIMKNFFKMDYIRYLAWKEMNPEKTLDKEIIFESRHLYSKAPITYLLHNSNVSNYEIKIDPISYFDEDDMIIFSSDKNCKNILKCCLSGDEKKFSINTPTVYVSFPCPYISKLYAFGINNFGKLGIPSNIKEISTPKLIAQLAHMDIADIKIGETSCIILDKKGEIYTAGHGYSAGIDKATEIFKVPDKYRKEHLINNEKVNFIEMNNQSVVINTKDGNLWFVLPSNIYGSINKDDNIKANQHKIKTQLTSLSTGLNHTIYTTADGKLFFTGTNDKYQSGQNFGFTQVLTPKEINFRNSDFYIMASAGDYFSAFIVKNKTTGKKNLYTAGWSKDGRSGIDDKGEFHTAHMFEDENNLDREYIYVSTSEATGAVISNDGKLYTWGANTKGECGHGNYEVIKTPTLVKFFDKDYFVLDVKCISLATIVIARNITTENISLFCMGDNSKNRLGLTQKTNYELKDTLPFPVINPFFEGKYPEKIYGGSKGVIVKCKVQNIIERRDNFNCACEDCGVNIKKKMGYNLHNKKLLCEECEQKDEYSNNDVIIFKAKLPEKDEKLIHKKLEDIFKEEKIEKINNNEKIICEGCSEEIIVSEKHKYFYSYHLIENENNNELNKNKKIIRKYLCDYCIDHFPPCLTNIKIFYQETSTEQVISEKSLELLLNEEKYYDISTAYGYKFSLSLTLNDEGCEQIIAKNQKELESFTKELKEVNKFEVYEQFVDYLNDMSQKAEKSLFNYNAKDLTFKKENISVRNELVNCSNEVLKKMFVLLKILNNKVKVLLPLIDFSKNNTNSERLSLLFNSISPLIFWEIKNDIIEYYIDKTSYSSLPKQLRINRFKAKKFIDKGKPDTLGEHTVWGQTFQFLRLYPPKIFRKKKVDKKNMNLDRNNKLFSASFTGEGSIDAGGPYRECLSTIYSELQSNALSLFIPTPNQKNDTGSFREKWTVNPGAVNNSELEMFKVFGGMMGFAIRTGEFFNMDLCSIFWKSILGIEKDKKDLEKFDKYCTQFLDNIEFNNDKESFMPFTEYKFVTNLSNGTEVELCENGNNKTLSLENKKEFIELLLKTRLNEGNVQIQSIRNGLEQVIPFGLLKLLSWNELEMLVCGKPILDIELLKENTQYNGCNINDQLIQNFWKCLEEFSAEERASYLRFVWGRSRLPLTSKDFPMQHRISIKSHNNPDLALPMSHTCFFSIDLPRYSSYEVLKSKLKYAITHCQAIDTDMVTREIWDDEE